MFENSKHFPKLVGLSALLIAGSAAFFSVFGLSKLFAGAQLAVIIMAGSLEFGKLVAASFLYRYWDEINTPHKIYMTIATGILILITSAGIFGFLSNAYQGATVEFEKESTALIFKEDRLQQLQEDKVFLKEELSVAISELPDNYITAKRKLREDYNPQILMVNEEILDYKKTRADLEIQLVSTGVDVGPAIYLARTFGTDIDTVVKFFIFILIFVFDPLAVMLVIAYNQALIDRSKKPQTLPDTPASPEGKVKTQEEHWKDIYSEPAGFTALIEDEERMDIIGQNGNDGLHYDEEPNEPLDENNPQPTARGGIRTK